MAQVQHGHVAPEAAIKLAHRQPAGSWCRMRSGARNSARWLTTGEAYRMPRHVAVFRRRALAACHKAAPAEVVGDQVVRSSQNFQSRSKSGMRMPA